MAQSACVDHPYTLSIAELYNAFKAIRVTNHITDLVIELDWSSPTRITLLRRDVISLL